MHRVLVLYGTPENAEAFKDYYLNTHVPLASTVPGVRSLRYSFDLAAPDGPSPYYGVSEVEFESGEALEAAMASPLGQQVMGDIPNYATGGFVVMDYPLLGEAPEPTRPQVIGVHEIELTPGADPAEYEKLVLSTLAHPVPDALRIRLYKADRGARTGKYAMTIEVDTVANRDVIFPADGSDSDAPVMKAWEQEHPAASKAWDRFNDDRGSTEVLFTDYVAVEG